MIKECFIFDIDGTLANGEHRVHHIVRSDGKPKDWDNYFAAMRDDTPITPLFRLANALSVCYEIVYVSGRPEEYREHTETWLAKHGMPPGPVYMRALGDRRDDNIIKIELLAKLIEDGFTPIMAFDDRNRVVKAWRDAGICCAQVAEGDF